MKLANRISVAYWAMAMALTAALLLAIFMAVSSMTRGLIEAHLNDMTAAKAANVETYLDMLSVSAGQLSMSITLEDHLKAHRKDPQNCEREFDLAQKRLRNTRSANPNILDFHFCCF